MADDPTAPAPAPAGAPASDDPKVDETSASTEEQLAALTAKYEQLKENSRKWESRSKANSEKAKAYDDLQAANATPDQKLAAAEERAAKAEKELARHRVAAELGVPAALLAGDDEDAMREHAAALKAFVGEKAKAPAPKPDPTQGGSGGQPKTSAKDEGLAEARRRFGKKS